MRSTKRNWTGSCLSSERTLKSGLIERRFEYSKRGATSVFLTMILASVLLLVGLFIHAASQAAGRSCADAVFELAGRSVLSEYDLTLKERYGVFAVHTDERQAGEKLKYYADYSFHDDVLKELMRGREHTDALKLKLNSVDVSLKGYSITDAGLFEEQILEHIRYDLIKDVISVDTSYPALQPPSTEEPGPEKNVVLRNGQIINGLPSNGYSSSFFPDIKRLAENGIPNLEALERSGRNNFLVNEYIVRHFLNHGREKEVRDTFFRNEVEYVLKGNFSDSGNYSAVRTDLFIMRNVLNLLHISQDPEKRKEMAAVAAALTLAGGKEIGMIVVAEAWAAAESENDLRLLEAGKEVAVVKNKDNWAVPLSDTLEFIWKDDYMKPMKISGYDYEDYLRILLFFENREQKLFRCMDLIQLNMKGNSNQNFDLKEHYGGFQFEAVVGDQKFSYIQRY